MLFCILFLFAVTADSLAAAREDACVCPMMIVAPVCGSNGHTYANECYLNCESAQNPQVTQLHAGRCKEQGQVGEPSANNSRPCVCPMMLAAPVCGSDGHTYINTCELHCAGVEDDTLEVIHQGSCEPDRQDGNLDNPGLVLCPFIYMPVCSTDGVTFANRCLLEAAVQVFAYNGKCRGYRVVADPVDLDRVFCPMIYKPVCSTDGVTFANRCLLEAAVQVFAYNGPCKGHRGINLWELGGPFCPIAKDPVCSTNGKTFDNMCMLQSAGQVLAYKGKCTGRGQRGINLWELGGPFCPIAKDPVCSTNGVTFDNMCMLQSVGHVLAYKGRCRVTKVGDDNDQGVEEVPSFLCQAGFAPVCSTSGTTFTNECELIFAGQQLAYSGPCEPTAKVPTTAEKNILCLTPCALMYQPVCSTLGVTFQSLCTMYCTSGQQLAHWGPCKPTARVAAAALDPSTAPAGDRNLFCACYLLYQPVCSTQGVTFGNKCMLECAGQQLAHMGDCSKMMSTEVQDRVAERSAAKNCICHMAYFPVCSTSGMTFGNKCMMNCYGQQLAYEGPCKPTSKVSEVGEKTLNPLIPGCDVITAVFWPVCSTAGATFYFGPRELQCAGHQFAYNGPCKQTSKATEGGPLGNLITPLKPGCNVITNVYWPVCSTAGVTFFSGPGQLHCFGHQLAYNGPCKPKDATARADARCNCPLMYQPVCSTLGITFHSKCMMDCTGHRMAHTGMCRRRTTAPRAEEERHWGEQINSAQQKCRPVVCPFYFIKGRYCTKGEDGRVRDHGNGCIMEQAMCSAEAAGQSLVHAKCK